MSERRIVMSPKAAALVRRYAAELKGVVLDEDMLGAPGINRALQNLIASAEAQKKELH